jgi:hypothetical protein
MSKHSASAWSLLVSHFNELTQPVYGFLPEYSFAFLALVQSSFTIEVLGVDSHKASLMQLLRLEEDGGYHLVEHFGNEIPPYAILSHTLGADHDEVTFKDLQEGTGTEKVGRGKLAFCASRAIQDDLRFFWLDTCCIRNVAQMIMPYESGGCRRQERWALLTTEDVRTVGMVGLLT